MAKESEKLFAFSQCRCPHLFENLLTSRSTHLADRTFTSEHSITRNLSLWACLSASKESTSSQTPGEVAGNVETVPPRIKNRNCSESAVTCAIQACASLSPFSAFSKKLP